MAGAGGVGGATRAISQLPVCTVQLAAPPKCAALDHLALLCMLQGPSASIRGIFLVLEFIHKVVKIIVLVLVAVYLVGCML